MPKASTKSIIREFPKFLFGHKETKFIDRHIIVDEPKNSTVKYYVVDGAVFTKLVKAREVVIQTKLTPAEKAKVSQMELTTVTECIHPTTKKHTPRGRSSVHVTQIQKKYQKEPGKEVPHATPAASQSNLEPTLQVASDNNIHLTVEVNGKRVLLSATNTQQVIDILKNL